MGRQGPAGRQKLAASKRQRDDATTASPSARALRRSSIRLRVALGDRRHLGLHSFVLGLRDADVRMAEIPARIQLEEL